MTHRIQILNGSTRDTTLEALRKANSKAKDPRAKRIIHRLASGLRANPSPPAAGRRAPTSKGEPMAKKHQRRATHRRTVSHKKTSKRRHYRRNPTAAPKVVTFRGPSRRRKSAKRRVASAFSGIQRKTGINLKEVALIGVGIAGGSLLSSFVEKQSEEYLPDLNPYARIGVVTLTLGVGGYFIGKYLNKSVGTGVIAGAIGEAIRSVGRNLAPGIFAGAEEEGYFNNPRDLFMSPNIKRGYTLEEPVPIYPPRFKNPMAAVRLTANPRRIGSGIGHQLGDLYLAPSDSNTNAPAPQLF